MSLLIFILIASAITHGRSHLAAQVAPELYDRGTLDDDLEEINQATPEDLGELVAECGVDGAVPAIAMRSAEGLRGVMCAYLAGRPTVRHELLVMAASDGC